MATDTLVRLDDLAELRTWREAQAPRSVHFVPTMGNLHAGHLALVAAARQADAAIIASIFVNPTQFGPGEDYQRYPRTLEGDLEALSAAGCDAVWLPDEATMYPNGAAEAYSIQPPSNLTDCLCGTGRPGHFEGVCSVVMRLLWQIRPDRAWFGEKDWQQLVIIRRMVEEFAVPVALSAVPTVRDERGLALSSRNAYLAEADLRRASALYRTLCALADEARKAGPAAYGDLQRRAVAALRAAGFEVEYVEFRDAGTLGAPRGHNDRLFAAARLGAARLIDNVAVTRQNHR
jgi:pantoate--beta-alanine ligase